ncbi:MAG: delta-60 repeat domain-containing protein, partial [Acidobacteriota bacterium]|nr:delta-60 repeat domain-containing protein [Acidobacteriota bacterium]
MNKKTALNVVAFNSSKEIKFSLTILFSLFFLLTSQQLQAQTQLSLPAFSKGAIETKPISPRASRTNLDTLPISTDKSAASNREQITSPTAEGDVDVTFNAGITEGFGFVEQTIVQPDGKIIVGGSFSGVSGAPRNSLARINADGSLDATFNPGGAGPNASIYALALQPDGKILIGGNGALYNGAYRGTITRLNADGTPDETFNPDGDSADGIVETIAVQPDGKILIGGLFSAYNNSPRDD